VQSAGAQVDALTVTRLAEALGVDQPRASRLAAQAVEAGLLRRQADQEDGRRSLLVLTDAGTSALTDIRGFRCRVIAEVTADWPPSERAQFARLLTRFVRGFQAVAAP
jgi:DNA-binding MarR family transcriptional regulator